MEADITLEYTYSLKHMVLHMMGCTHLSSCAADLPLRWPADKNASKLHVCKLVDNITRNNVQEKCHLKRES